MNVAENKPRKPMKYFLVIIFAGRAQLLLGIICFSDKIIFAFEIASLQREMIV